MASPGAITERQELGRPPERGPGLVLLVDDEPLMLRSLRRILNGEGHRTVLAESAADAIPSLADPELAVVLVDLFLGATSGLDLLERVKLERPENALQRPAIKLFVIDDEHGGLPQWDSSPGQGGTPM